MRELRDVAIAFDAACRAAGVGYAIMGGLAVSAWGAVRTTRDVDALVRLERNRASDFAAALASRSLSATERDFLDAMQGRSHVIVFDPGSGFHVDVKLAFTPEERDEVESAIDVPIEGASLRIVRPEETIVFKLKFGSPQDLSDARSILVRQEGKLDLQRLWSLADRLGVREPLAQLMQELAAHLPPDDGEP